MTDLQVQELFEEIAFQITAPGLIDQASSNADSYEGNAATWNLAFGEMRNIHLESRAS